MLWQRLHDKGKYWRHVYKVGTMPTDRPAPESSIRGHSRRISSPITARFAQ